MELPLNDDDIIIYLTVLPVESDGKEYGCNAEDPGSIPGSGRSPEERNGNPLRILAWRTPLTEEPAGLQSMESKRVRHGWATTTRVCNIQQVLRQTLKK